MIVEQAVGKFPALINKRPRVCEQISTTPLYECYALYEYYYKCIGTYAYNKRRINRVVVHIRRVPRLVRALGPL